MTVQQAKQDFSDIAKRVRGNGGGFPAPGIMGVDWEQRLDFRRLHDYRLGRARDALKASELGAVLVFDMNNVRYLTSTHIGEWARDKMTRFALLTRGGEPHLWDFGSAINW